MKYIILYENFLNESKELDIANKYKGVITDNMFNILSKIDVTPTRKYLDKICNFFVNDKSPDNSKIENLHHAFSNFNNLVNKKIIKGADSDIAKYKTLKDLNIVVDKYSKIESQILEKKLKKANIIRIKDDKDLFICVPLDEETSKIYGSNTRWCVSAKENNAYKDYFKDRKDKNNDYYSKLLENNINEAGGPGDEEGSCFVSFIINKQLESSNPLHKVAIQFGNEYSYYTIFDSLDGSDVNHCIDKAEEYNIELPQEYHDMMKKYGTYKKYVEKCLNIDIKKLYHDIKSQYFIIQVDEKNKYKKYLEFISPEPSHDSNFLTGNDLYYLKNRFDKNSKKIPDELVKFYNILKTDNHSIRILYDYYIELQKYCKDNKLGISPIKGINTYMIIAGNKKNYVPYYKYDNNDEINYDTIDDIIKDIPTTISQIHVVDMSEFERFDKMNTNNKFGVHAVGFYLEKELDDKDVFKINNDYYYNIRFKTKDKELNDIILKSYIDKLNINTSKYAIRG